METQTLIMNTQPEPAATITIPKATISLQVPDYPFPLKLEVQLTMDLSDHLNSIIDQEQKRVMTMDIIFNMLQAVMALAEPQEAQEKKSGLILT